MAAGGGVRHPPPRPVAGHPAGGRAVPGLGRGGWPGRAGRVALLLLVAPGARHAAAVTHRPTARPHSDTFPQRKSSLPLGRPAARCSPEGGLKVGVSPLPEPAYARCHGLAGPPLHMLPRRERPLPGVLLLRGPRPRPGGHVACVPGTGPCREDRLPSRQTGRPAPGGPRRGPLPLPGPRRHVVRSGPGDASRGPTERLAREPPALRLCPLRPTDPRRRQPSASRLGKPPAPRRRRTPPPHPRPDLLAPRVRPVAGAP